MPQAQQPEATTAPSAAQIKELMKKHRIWVEHSTLYEDDQPPRELRAVQAEQHQFEAYTKDLIALAATPAAAPVVAAIPDAAYCALQYVEHSLAAIANREELVGDSIERMDTIAKASKRAKAALTRLQAVVHHFNALEESPAAAAPVVLPEPVASVYTMEALVPGGAVKLHVDLYKPLPAGTKLFAEPDVRALLAGAAPSSVSNVTSQAVGCSVSNAETQQAAGAAQAVEPRYTWTGTEADDAMILLDRMDDSLEPERIAQLEKIVPRLGARIEALTAELAAARAPQAAATQAAPYAVLVREIGESSFFDSKPIKPGSVQHRHAKEDPHYDYVELYDHPAPAAQEGQDALAQAVAAERERICEAIKAEDDYCITIGDYMLDSDDCIKVARGEWVRPVYEVGDAAIAAQAQKGQA